MAVLKIDDFGGEFPRVPARALPGGAAQVNQNLLATSTDFRPVLGSTIIAAAAKSAITLYRRQRAGGGALLSNLADGWVSSTDDINYVPGQINEDTTERTYLTYNSGTRAPEMWWTNADGSISSTLLGVPPPPKPEISVLKFDAFTRTKAQEWIKSTLVPVAAKMVTRLLPDINDKTQQFKARFTTNEGATLLTGGSYGKSVAGVTTALNGIFEVFPTGVGSDFLSQRSMFEPWNLLMKIPSMNVCDEGMGNPQLGGIKSGDDTYIGVPAFPFWGTPDKTSVSNELQAYTVPHGVKMFTKAQADVVAGEIVALFSPTTPAVMQRRNQLEAARMSFIQAGYKAIQTITRPTDSAKLSEWKAQQAAAVSRMLDAQKTAGDISHEIEAMYVKMVSDVNGLLTTYFATKRLDRTVDFPDGLVNLDDDPVKETRFYFLTFTNELGQESAPGPLSDQLELTSGDLVSINQPAYPSNRRLTKYNIYRSNSGSETTAFQLVESVGFGSTVPAPFTTGTGNTDVPVEGYGTATKWRDIIANWVVYYEKYEERGFSARPASVSAYASTAALRIGDTVTQSGSGDSSGYSITMRWNGSDWTMQQVPNITELVGEQAYLDGKTGAMLNEVCPTLTWLEPPVVNNKQLRGLTAMPNGVMAGFIDNVIYFCEPYKGYAWPVEYSIPLGFPIVGLHCFGQTLVAGTRGNPSFISGSDSMSMSEQKLDSNQPCVSARSMVSALGGVFYASPDGYCFASQGGVEVVTLGLFANEDWQKLNPASIFATVHDSVLYFWYTGNGGGCYGLDTVAKKLTRHDIPATAVFDDVVTDSAYVVDDSKVKQLFSGVRATGEWTSGIATLPAQAPFAWAKVVSEFEDGAVTVQWTADGGLRRTATFTNKEPQRLPPGRYLEHTVKVTSKSRVTSVMLASTTEELKAV